MGIKNTPVTITLAAFLSNFTLYFSVKFSWTVKPNNAFFFPVSVETAGN